jgi:hypothetical protein
VLFRSESEPDRSDPSTHITLHDANGPR